MKVKDMIKRSCKDGAERIYELQKELQEICEKYCLSEITVQAKTDKYYNDCNENKQTIMSFPMIIVEEEFEKMRLRGVVSTKNVLELDQGEFDTMQINKITAVMSGDRDEYEKLENEEREKRNAILEKMRNEKEEEQ